MVVKPPVGEGWWLCLVVAGPAVGAWLAVVGGRVGGIATIGLRHAGDTPWRGVYGSKTPCWCGLAAVFGRGWACCGGVAGGCGWVCGWRLWVGAWLAVVGGCVGGIATIGVRHAGDTPWRGVYGSKPPPLVWVGGCVWSWLGLL